MPYYALAHINSFAMPLVDLLSRTRPAASASSACDSSKSCSLEPSVGSMDVLPFIPSCFNWVISMLASLGIELMTLRSALTCPLVPNFRANIFPRKNNWRQHQKIIASPKTIGSFRDPPFGPPPLKTINDIEPLLL